MPTRPGGGGGGVPGRGKRVSKAAALNKRTGALKKGFVRKGNTYMTAPTGGGGGRRVTAKKVANTTKAVKRATKTAKKTGRRVAKKR